VTLNVLHKHVRVVCLSVCHAIHGYRRVLPGSLHVFSRIRSDLAGQSGTETGRSQIFNKTVTVARPFGNGALPAGVVYRYTASLYRKSILHTLDML
jgi:hypothetical protein